MKNQDSILRDFYSGKLIPHERKVNYSKAFYALVHNLEADEKEFCCKLNKPQQKHYEKIRKMQTEIHSRSEEELFTYAFSLGVRMTAEAFLHGESERE